MLVCGYVIRATFKYILIYAVEGTVVSIRTRPQDCSRIHTRQDHVRGWKVFVGVGYEEQKTMNDSG